MRHIFLMATIAMLILASCNNVENDGAGCGCDDNVYHNMKTILVSKESTPYRYFLVRGVEDTTLIGEIKQTTIGFSDSIFHTKMPGDTVFFERIGKTRFWHKPTSARHAPAIVKLDSIQVIIVAGPPLYEHSLTTVIGSNATALRKYADERGITKDASGLYVIGSRDFSEFTNTKK